MVLRRLMRVVDRPPVHDDGARAVRVAFATTDMKHVDQHFGTAQRYAVYRVTTREARLLYAAQFGSPQRDGAGEEKLAARIALLEGCAFVYCQAIGAGAIRRLLPRGIHPRRVDPRASISVLVADLQKTLKQDFRIAPRPLSGVEESGDEGRFEVMDAEGWNEEG